MKKYPKIPSYKIYPKKLLNKKYYVFSKEDGSNIRAEWTKKNGFHKFGSRNHLIDETDLLLGEAPSLVLSKYEKDISDIMKKNRLDRGVFFFEFYGKNSFAGYHADEAHTVTLFDVNLYRKGMMDPRAFLRLFGHLDCPALLHYGKVNSTIVDQVKNSTLTGMTYEGVVCKGLPVRNKLAMFKIKSEAWLSRLKNECGDDEELFEKLK